MKIALFRTIADTYLRYVYACCDLVYLAAPYVTPDGISYTRTFMGLSALPFLHFQLTLIGNALLVASLYLDHIDGVWARRYKMETRWGGYIDRSCDKIQIIAYLLYFVVAQPIPLTTHPLFMSFTVVLVLIETIALLVSLTHWISESMEHSVHLAHSVSTGRARWPGKTKMILECALIVIITTAPLHELLTTAASLRTSFEMIISGIVLITAVFALSSLVGHIIEFEQKNPA